MNPHDVLAFLLQAVIVEGWIIAALLCWRYDTWKPVEPKPNKDGLLPINRLLVDAIARGRL